MSASSSSSDDDASSSSSSDEDMGEQVRISLTLSAECPNRALQVPSEPIAVPADINRKGLSTVINHLLNRRLTDDNDDLNDDHDDDDDDDQLPAIHFDFLLGKSNNNKLLRTALEREARRIGLSLEEAIPITYFPAQRAPELTGTSDVLPDWISTLCFAPSVNVLCAGCYDGSVHVFSTQNGTLDRISQPTSSNTHQGPIKCMATATTQDSNDDSVLWIATGSMDHSLVLQQVEHGRRVKIVTKCMGGHASSIASVDLFPTQQQTLLMASGDWDGGVCFWKLGQDDVVMDPDHDEEQPTKKSKTASSKEYSVKNKKHIPQQSPFQSLQAHSSKVSGLSWGNFEKNNNSGTLGEQLITASWDYGIKVWNVERQDCLLTLNGSRVVSCLDTSYFSTGIVATGHPDCTIGLWDVRVGNTGQSSAIVSDNTFRPSHKAWVSAVEWSRHNPYHLASTSHDGCVKLWDIRSPLPLHTVRAFAAKTEKGLALAYGDAESGLVYAGGTDCIVKQFSSVIEG